MLTQHIAGISLFPLALTRWLKAALFITFFLAFSPAQADAPVPHGKAELVVNADTGTVLHEMQSTGKRFPASLTKMMTLYLTFEALANGSLKKTDKLTTTYEATIAGSANALPNNKFGLQTGQKLTVDDAIKGAAIYSANDAANVLGIHLGGSKAGFATMMTAKAAALGMSSTNFTNPSGLVSNQQYTTARDLAMLARALRQHFPQYYPYFKLKSFTFNGRVYTHHNSVTHSLDGADGVKTGFTSTSGSNLVTSAIRKKQVNGQEKTCSLIGVVLGGTSSSARNTRMIQIMEEGFTKCFKTEEQTTPPAQPPAQPPAAPPPAQPPAQPSAPPPVYPQGSPINAFDFINCPINDITSPTVPNHQGNGRTLDGTKDHDEKPDCPEVDCNRDSRLTQRVNEYFTYTAPRNNRTVLEDKSQHDYEVNKGDRFLASNSQRKGGYNMKQVDCSTRTNNQDVNEPCQDNRYRDACMIGGVPPDGDVDFSLYARKLDKDEEPWPGVRGTRPLFDASNSQQINCMVPKKTPVISPLLLDNGWRFRYMCPGDKELRRVPEDTFSEKQDYFRGTTNCFAPIPKCPGNLALQSDWLITSNNWIGQAYGTFASLYRGGIASVTGHERTLNGVMAILSPAQQAALRQMFYPDVSRGPECKPAFWVRFMMDSCANQFVSQLAAKPNLVFNPDIGKPGLSPRFCQPLRTVLVQNEEYKVNDYLKRAAKGLLQHDYMPWIKYDRFKGPQASALQDKWERSQPPRRIGGLKEFQNNALDLKFTKLIPPSINDYAAHPVERILDASHPYSPRYDIAIFSNDGANIDDRILFKDATATVMVKNPLIGGKCLPASRKGYFEYGDCTVYCSAVKVDVLRFRYEDYRVCMGCQIDGNSFAFWSEVDKNMQYYQQQRCWVDQHNGQENKSSSDNNCNYGQNVCHKCQDAAENCTKAASYCGACSVTGTTCSECADYTTKCADDTKQCGICNVYAYEEAISRARKRINYKQEPEYGPTKTKEDGKNWPVCSTRYDYPGEPDLCKQAKQNSGNCQQQAQEAAKDENIGKVSNVASSCVNKTIDEICHDAAKPVVGINFLKIRPRKAGAASEDKDWTEIKTRAAAFAGPETPDAYQFRHHFGNHRPYMRWWDTGQESFQIDPLKPDYACDWGSNDQYIGVGRDANSIHGRDMQICGYGGGGGVGNNCFDIASWKQKFPDLAGTEWAELKMYQANCFRTNGLNCLCQYEKIFKQQGSEERILQSYSANIQVREEVAATPTSGTQPLPNGGSVKFPGNGTPPIVDLGNGKSVQVPANGTPPIINMGSGSVFTAPSTNTPGNLKVGNTTITLPGAGQNGSINFGGGFSLGLPDLTGKNGTLTIPGSPPISLSHDAQISRSFQLPDGRTLTLTGNGQQLTGDITGIGSFKVTPSGTDFQVDIPGVAKGLLSAAGSSLNLDGIGSVSTGINGIGGKIDLGQVGSITLGGTNGGSVLDLGNLGKFNLNPSGGASKTIMKSVDIRIPMGWRGYISTPVTAEQFPNLYGKLGNSIVKGGLDNAKVGDVILFPSSTNTLPYVALVTQVYNAASFGGNKTHIEEMGGNKSIIPSPFGGIPTPSGGSSNKGYKGYVVVVDANNGKLPDACGNTTMLDYGPPRTLYARVEDLPEDLRQRMEEQITATYYCDDSTTRICVERNWDNVTLYRPSQAPRR